MAIEVIRTLMLIVQEPACNRVTVRVQDEVASYLNNRKRRELHSLEQEGNLTIQILGSEGLHPEHLELDCRNAKGETIPFNPVTSIGRSCGRQSVPRT